MKKLIPGWVYILKCSDGSYYAGSTTDLVRRMNEDIMGTLRGYTSTRLPVELLYSRYYDDIKEAMEREQQIKGWTRKKKEALIRENINLLHELAKCKNESSHARTD